MNKVEKWVSMQEICDHLGFGKDTVKRLIKEQGLPAYKPDDKIWKFKISEVDEWMITKRINIQTAKGDGEDV
jgi:excisionase family DNA binding protein